MSQHNFKWTAILVLALVALLAAACGGTAPSATNNAAAVILSQTISTADKTLTVKYPEGWTATDLGAALQLNNAVALPSDPTGALPAGLLMAQVMAVPADGLTTLGAAENASLSDILNLVSGSTAGSGVTMDKPVEFENNGKKAALATGTVELAGNKAEMAVVLVKVGEGYVLVTWTGAEGEVAKNDAIIRAVAGSIETAAAG
ncbi:MAG TPA: hypothetical protein VHO69_17600 [Phototrophicaceae bacterium]|nr:hypothetical protein [Phototrophicaceae bacterium]